MSGGPNASVPVPQPDGSGGAGSFGAIGNQFLAMITGRAAAFLDGEIQRRFGGGLSEGVAVDAAGRVRPESQPGTPAAETTIAGLLASPVAWVVGVGVVIGVILLARK